MRRIFAIALVLSIILSALVQKANGQSASDKWELADAFPPFSPAKCLTPNARERSLLDIAASAIEKTGDDISWLDIGAQKYLAHNQFRTVEGRGVAVCTPEDILRRVAAAFDSRKAVGKGRWVEYQLELAARLPTRSRAIVEAAGNSAFNQVPQESDIFRRRDIRPFARAVLASFGPEARPFQAMAYQQMSIADSMGTGAAQVAAASGHPNALPRIERMMDETLAAIPAEKAIPRNTRNRLYELAWAIRFSGDAGKGHTKPIHKMMHRRVQSWAPPFGMVDLQPKQLCGILSHIEGADSLKAYPFCLDDKMPLEQ